ncbi:MAG TPA: hypothetical protein PLX08_06605 [Bacteroidales bacterium]|jgi:hypothetical protein|nr:hypothetical protein [Bacteroidales bacterium]
MRTIRNSAESILTANMNFANGQIKVRLTGSNEGNHELFTLRSFVEHEARSNPNFFRWLFDDYSIEYFGNNLSKEQKEEYTSWLHDL